MHDKTMAGIARTGRRAGTPKGPHPTAERILDTALALFNRFGEPNVSTSVVAQELGISPGNLHYHYPAKEQIVNALFDRYAQALQALLGAAHEVEHVEDAWLFFHMLFERLWQHRFLYRDLNDLVSRNRFLETRFRRVLDDTTRAVQAVLDGLSRTRSVHFALGEAAPVGTAMVVLLTYWLSYEYVRDPRHALEPEAAGAAVARGAFHVLSLLLPYFEPEQKRHLLQLVAPYAGHGDA